MLRNKKVLIVAYYWPPSGGSGVQRWLKFSKYLAKLGMEPIVIVPENAAYPDIDTELLKEVPDLVQVEKVKIIEPYQILNKFSKSASGGTGEVTNGKKGLKAKLMTWVRGNLFFPDPRTFWVNSCVKRAEKLIHELDIHYLITTGPPHSVHLTGYKIKKRKPEVQWLADFRDPWTDIFYFKDFGFSDKVVQRHKSMEKNVVSAADVVLSASPKMIPGLKAIGAKRIETITNGFDPDDFAKPQKKGDGFVISHVGVLFNKRNSEMLWKALKELCSTHNQFNADLQLRFAGEVGEEIKGSIDALGLSSKTTYLGYLNQKEAVKEQLKAGLSLVLLANNEKTIVPGKVVELFGAKNPILGIAPVESPVNDLLEETHYGKCFENSRDQIEGLKDFILQVYSNQWQIDYDASLKYSRPKMAEKLINILESVSN